METQIPNIIERTILANQFHILAALSEDEYESEQHKVKADILERGLESEYYQIFDQMHKETVSNEVSGEVFDTLEMFRKIRWAVDALTEEQKSKLDLKKLSFRGFDANNDRHFRFLAWWDKQNPDSTYREELGHIGGYNSHTKFSLAEYRGMLKVFETFNFNGSPRLLTFEELQKLQDAQTIWEK